MSRPRMESEADLSRLAVIFPNVRSNQHQTCEHLRHILKIDAVFGDVCLSFGFVPFEPHSTSVRTQCMYVNRVRCVCVKGLLQEGAKED